MDKKKAVICTILFGVIMIAMFGATFYIENDNSLTLFEFLSPTICGLWVGERVGKFYKWLTK